MSLEEQHAAYDGQQRAKIASIGLDDYRVTQHQPQPSFPDFGMPYFD